RPLRSDPHAAVERSGGRRVEAPRREGRRRWLAVPEEELEEVDRIGEVQRLVAVDVCGVLAGEGSAREQVEEHAKGIRQIHLRVSVGVAADELRIGGAGHRDLTGGQQIPVDIEGQKYQVVVAGVEIQARL